MSNFEKAVPVKVVDVAEAVFRGKQGIDQLTLYAASDVDSINIETICYLDDYPVIKNDEEIFPAFVEKKELTVMYYGQQFEDVVRNVSAQVSSPTPQQFILALNYYAEKDDFLDL